MCNHHRIISASKKRFLVHITGAVQFLVQKSIWMSSLLNLHRIGYFGLESNVDRNCAFEQFESGPKLEFDTSIYIRNLWSRVKMQFGPFSNWMRNFQTRNKTLGQNCNCDDNPTRDTELIKTHFWTENWTPSYSRKHMNSEMFSEAGEMVSN